MPRSYNNPDKLSQISESQSWQNNLSNEHTSDQPPPIVSVIIPTYNRPENLLDAVRSVLKQTFPLIEAVVINDCGVDISNILKALNDPRVVHVRHNINKGLAATRNTGIRTAKGKYIAYLDDDDEYYPNHVQTLVDALESSEFKFAYTDGEKCLYEEKDGKLLLYKKFIEYSHEFDPLRILIHNYIPVICVMHEKSCLDYTGLFDETMAVHEDWDLWARFSLHFPFRHIKKTTCSYKMILNAQKNLTTSRRIDFLKTMQQIYRKHFNITKNNPQLLEYQHKMLLNLAQTLYPKNLAINISVRENFNIFINDTKLAS